MENFGITVLFGILLAIYTVSSYSSIDAMTGRAADRRLVKDLKESCEKDLLRTQVCKMVFVPVTDEK